MAKKRTPGLYKRKGIWHIDKQLFGCRLCESTGTASLAEAQLYLARRIEETRQTKVYGVRVQHTFDEAAKKYVSEKNDKATIQRDIRELTRLHHYLANQPLEMIHMDCEGVQNLIKTRRREGVKTRTINYTLQVLRHLLNLATEWRDENGMPWLERVPKIRLYRQMDSRPPRSLSWEEQDQLFPQLPYLLREMALYAVNTGCRDQEICQLQWEWEVPVPELNTSIFILPARYIDEQGNIVSLIKNGEDKLVVLNRVAKAVVDRQRGNGSRYVFAHLHQGKLRPYYTMNTNGWQAARVRAEVSDVRVHDLRHTFGRRLRSAGVSHEDRKDLLGHKSGEITTHYSPAEIENLITAANKICEKRVSTPTLTVVRGGAKVRSRKTPASKAVALHKINVAAVIG